MNNSRRTEAERSHEVRREVRRVPSGARRFAGETESWPRSRRTGVGIGHNTLYRAEWMRRRIFREGNRVPEQIDLEVEGKGR